MAKKAFPVFGIDHLVANRSDNDLLNADRFSDYLAGNPHLSSLHSHSFYHLLYFTEGAGTHSIDFVSFPVKKGMLYFMKPGQVHAWDFKGKVDGYIVNFSPTFFDRQFIGTRLVDRFPFFGGKVERQVVQVHKDTQPKAEALLRDIVSEQAARREDGPAMIAALLLQFFLLVNRQGGQPYHTESPGYHATILHNFERLLEDHFRELRLPKDYAALLYITPNHLNALCKEWLGMPVGEVIRNRVVLEAKRLLIDFGLSVGEIARELHFVDASYFVKFFKKYTGHTPDQFRQMNYA